MNAAMRRDVFCREIKLWHAPIRASVLNHGSDQFAVLIVQNKFTTNQIGAAFATARIRSVTETAIGAKNLAAARNHCRVGRRPYRIGGRPRHASRWGGRRLGRGLRCCLGEPGSWAGVDETAVPPGLRRPGPVT